MIESFRATTTYVITNGSREVVGYASELFMAEELASQGRSRLIWRRQRSGTYKLISQPRYMQ